MGTPFLWHVIKSEEAIIFSCGCGKLKCLRSRPFSRDGETGVPKRVGHQEDSFRKKRAFIIFRGGGRGGVFLLCSPPSFYCSISHLKREVKDKRRNCHIKVLVRERLRIFAKQSALIHLLNHTQKKPFQQQKKPRIFFLRRKHAFVPYLHALQGV